LIVDINIIWSNVEITNKKPQLTQR